MYVSARIQETKKRIIEHREFIDKEKMKAKERKLIEQTHKIAKLERLRKETVSPKRLKFSKINRLANI